MVLKVSENGRPDFVHRLAFRVAHNVSETADLFLPLRETMGPMKITIFTYWTFSHVRKEADPVSETLYSVWDTIRQSPGTSEF
jgi:hypothetical protein